MYDVIVIKEGYCRPEQQGTMRASGSVTLLKGLHRNILVDTGSPWDKDEIILGLQKQGINPDDINYVVCTHGHPDHVGNTNLFTKAVLIMGFNIQFEDQYILHDFKQGIPYEIDDLVEVWPTPGHTSEDVSVIVKATNLGTVVVAGDLFECEADLDCPLLWQEQSDRPSIQEQSRQAVLHIADFIVPGHGSMFQVPAHMKSQMKVVMLAEDHVSSSDVSETATQYVISETE